MRTSKRQLGGVTRPCRRRAFDLHTEAHQAIGDSVGSQRRAKNMLNTRMTHTNRRTRGDNARSTGYFERAGVPPADSSSN